MTTITENVTDIAGVDDNTSWTFFTQVIRESDTDGTIITTKKVRKYPIAGVLTVELDPGPAVVLAADGKTYPFTVPDDDSQLWPLIQAAVTIPPGTKHEELVIAVEDWLERNANIWDGISDKPAPLAAGANVANGYAGLDGSGKLNTAQLPISAMEYKGNWNASTNSPTLADGTGSAGDVYKVATGAARNLGSGSITWDVGDYVIYNGTTWEKSDNTDAVASVAGRTGAVTLTKTDVGLSSVDNTADTAKPVSTAQAAADAAVLAASAKAITGVQVVAVPTGTAATDTAAIQAAHDALPAAGGTIMLHAGLYALTNPGPTFTKKVHLIGISPADGNLAGGTQLWSNSTSATGLTINPTASWPTGIGSTIENISFINNDALTPASGVGLRIVDATGLQIRRCSFFNFYDNISIEGGYAWAVRESLVNNCGRYGIRVRNLVDPDTGDGTITGCWFLPLGGAPTPTAAIRWESDAGLRIVNNKFNQGAKQWGIAIDAAFQGDVKDTGGIYIWNNSIENISGTGIKLSRITGAFSTYLTQIQNNEFQTMTTGIILDDGWSNIIVSDNVGKSLGTPVSSTGALLISQDNNQWNGTLAAEVGKTLTDPRIGTIKDTNGNTIFDTSQPTASAVNTLGTWNGATGAPVYLWANGTDTNVGLNFLPKGNAGVQVLDSAFASVAGFYGVASAVNSFQMYNSATGAPAVIGAIGSDTNVSISVNPKGTGRLQENGNTAASWVSVPATATSTGKVGQQAADSSWLYICTATNTWRRVAIATW